MIRLLATTAFLALAGCASTYHVALMPRDSGKLYEGVIEDTRGSEGPMSVTIEGRTYTGTWVEVVPGRTSAYSTGGYGGRHYGGGWGWGGSFSMTNPQGGEAKALLRAPDGAGLRCDLRSGGDRAGGGVCFDDKGLGYDLQIRLIERK
jgi:hypothetical protein